MESLYRVRAEFRKHHRLTELFVILPDIRKDKRFYGAYIGRFVVPAVIAVDADYIRHVRNVTDLERLGGLDQRYGQIRQTMRQIVKFFIIRTRRFFVSSGFVRKRNHNHARVVFIPIDHGRQRGFMYFKKFFVDSAFAESITAPESHAHGGTLVDNHNSVTVGKV